MKEIKYVGVSGSITSKDTVFVNGVNTLVDDAVADYILSTFKGDFELISKPVVKTVEELKEKPTVESIKKVVK